jgi:hypothetical protein
MAPELLVFPSGVYKWSINLFTNLHPVYSHTPTRDNMKALEERGVSCYFRESNLYSSAIKIVTVSNHLPWLNLLCVNLFTEPFTASKVYRFLIMLRNVVNTCVEFCPLTLSDRLTLWQLQGKVWYFSVIDFLWGEKLSLYHGILVRLNAPWRFIFKIRLSPHNTRVESREGTIIIELAIAGFCCCLSNVPNLR